MIIIFLLLSYMPIIFAEVKSIPIPNGSTLNFTVNLNNIQEARATHSNTITHPQGNRLSDSPLLDKLSQVWVDPDTNQNLVKRFGNNTSSFLNDYKWPLFAGALITGYAYLCYLILSGNRYFAQKDLWSVWRNDLTFEQLLAIPQQQFAKELLQEIQRRYTDPAAITDIVRPLSRFVKMIEQEEEQLLWYQNAYSWIEYTNIKLIIPISTTQFGKISERLQRIAYLKNAFHTWAAQYQLEQVTQARHIALDTSVVDVSNIAALMAYHYKISLLNYLAQSQLRRTPVA